VKSNSLAVMVRRCKILYYDNPDRAQEEEEGGSCIHPLTFFCLSRFVLAVGTKGRGKQHKDDSSYEILRESFAESLLQGSSAGVPRERPRYGDSLFVSRVMPDRASMWWSKARNHPGRTSGRHWQPSIDMLFWGDAGALDLCWSTSSGHCSIVQKYIYLYKTYIPIACTRYAI